MLKKLGYGLFVGVVSVLITLAILVTVAALVRTFLDLT